MKQKLALLGLVSGLALAPLSAQAYDWLDTAYLVGSFGSTTQITQVSLDGPAPWLLLDLKFVFDPALNYGLDAIWFTADWSHQNLGLRINEAPASFPNAPSDKVWIEAANWANAKAEGVWSVTPHLNYIECIFIYGVGACFDRQAPGITVTVPVVNNPIPEPATVALTLAGLGLVGWRVKAKRT